MDDDRLWVELAGGRRLGVPLAWFPRLMRATAEAREAVEISACGLHWEALDEDISVSSPGRSRERKEARYLLNGTSIRSPE